MRKLGVANLLNGINEIKKVIVAGRNGVVKEAANEPNAEGVAAIVGFALNMFDRNGEMFGLGSTQRVVIKHGQGATITIPLEDSFLSAFLEDGTSVQTVERKLGGFLFGNS
jgi:predicted regulator of Ras-like GTPase activity (Roadblock/LC7/MglB family)